MSYAASRLAEAALDTTRHLRNRVKLTARLTCGARSLSAPAGSPTLPYNWDSAENKMDKDVAIAILSLAKSTDEIIGKLYLEVEKISDSAIKLQFDKAVGELMGSIARDLIFPIEQLYPDLSIDD
jgi:hypothetical protein